MPGPLAGLQVIEMAGLGPCPLAGQLLADLGADVIVIDRKAAPPDPTDINRRGKRSVVLNLKDTDAQVTARALINAAGIVIEGFRPGVMERLGLGPADLGEHVIFGRITGWGQDGPLAHTAGHDINYLAITGALAAMGSAGQPPPPPLNLVADYGGGTMFLLLGLLAAVHERTQSGKGQVIDAAMCEGVSAMMGLFHQFLAKGQLAHEREANLLDGGAPFYRCYETLDGKFMSVGALEPQFHAIFLDLAGLPSDHQTSQHDRAQWAVRRAQYARVFARKSQSEWCAIFEGSDACVAPVLDWDDMATHPQAVARGSFSAPEGILQTRPVPRFSRSVADTPSAPRGAGADTEQVLTSMRPKT